MRSPLRYPTRPRSGVHFSSFAAEKFCQAIGSVTRAPEAACRRLYRRGPQEVIQAYTVLPGPALHAGRGPRPTAKTRGASSLYISSRLPFQASAELDDARGIQLPAHIDQTRGSIRDVIVGVIQSVEEIGAERSRTRSPNGST